MSDILTEVRKTIEKDRQDIYGNPENSFNIIAQFWTTYLKSKYNIQIELNGRDIAIMMSLLKHARMVVQDNYRDNIIDAIGYLTILGERL